MLEVEGQDYVRTAKAKGLPPEQVHYKHALRNALLPFVTMFGLILPGLIGGSVIIESIFSWPGMGRMAYEAILARDYPIILTVNFVSAVLVLAGTFISDLLYLVAVDTLRGWAADKRGMAGKTIRGKFGMGINGFAWADHQLRKEYCQQNQGRQINSNNEDDSPVFHFHSQNKKMLRM